MVMHVERKHWYTRVPLSEVVLVFALLAGTAFAAAQVRTRDATIADQAAIIGRQAATIGQSEAQMITVRQAAEVDARLVEAYGLLQAQRAAMAKALRGESGEVYESYEVAAAGEQQAQGRIGTLQTQRQVRQVILYSPWANDY